VGREAGRRGVERGTPARAAPRAHAERRPASHRTGRRPTDPARMLPAGSGPPQTPPRAERKPKCRPLDPGRQRPGSRKKKGRGDSRHHGPHGSNRSPPANGVDLCENDADRVWGKHPGLFRGSGSTLRVWHLRRDAATECSKFGDTDGGLGQSTAVVAAGRIRRQRSFRQTDREGWSRIPVCPCFRHVRSTPPDTTTRPPSD
jgi:hypothetical protein